MQPVLAHPFYNGLLNSGGLTFAEGTVPTVKGLINTHWEKSANGPFSLSVNVLPNTRASVCLPKLSDGNFTITESGKLQSPVKSEVKDHGVLAVQKEGSSVKCLVGGAGIYRFIETLPSS